MKWIIFFIFVFCFNLCGKEIWILSPRITAMGGIKFASFDEDYTPNIWDVSGIKASRVFDTLECSQIMFKGFRSSDFVIIQDTSYYSYNGDTVEIIRSFGVEERDEGIVDIFILPKENFYFGTFAQVKEDFIADSRYDIAPFLLRSAEKSVNIEGYSGWKRDNLSLCISLGSISFDAVNFNSHTYKIEGSLALFIKPSFHFGFLQGYSKERMEYSCESYSYGKLYINEYVENISYTKVYFDWKRTQNSIIGVSTGVHRYILIEQPYDFIPLTAYQIDDFLLFYSDLFKFGDFEIPFAFSNFFGFFPWGQERIEEYDLTGLSVESGIRWKGKIICLQFKQNGDLRVGTEFSISKIKIRTGYMYEGSMSEWIDLSPHIVSGGLGTPIGNKCKLDLVIKKMYGIYIGGAEVRMNL